MEYPYDKFHYALQLAFKYPSVDCDDEGNYNEMPHHTFQSFCAFSQKIIDEMGISEEQFYKQDSIIPVIEAYGLNKEQFWYAVAYVNSLTRIWIRQKGLEALPTPVEQLAKLRDEISGRHEFKVVIDNDLESHSFLMAGNCLIGFLVNSIDDLIGRLKETGWAESHEIPVWRMSEYKKTEATWYAANLFKQLFDCLNLPVRRSRSTKKVFQTIEGQDVRVKGSDAEYSLDKNQLIAELIHFLDLTDNSGLDGNSISGVLKNKRKFSLGII